jgi:hypothetical protein
MVFHTGELQVTLPVLVDRGRRTRVSRAAFRAAYNNIAPLTLTYLSASTLMLTTSPGQAREFTKDCQLPW